jgi:hypothetical protein
MRIFRTEGKNNFLYFEYEYDHNELGCIVVATDWRGRRSVIAVGE